MNKEERRQMIVVERRARFLKTQKITALVITGIVVIISFGMFIARKVFGFDVLKSLGRDGDPNDHSDSSPIYLGVAVALSIGVAIWALIKVTRAKHLAANGVETTGVVASRGLLSKNGMRPTTVTYTVEGKEYKFRKDMPNIDKYEVGAIIEMIYDPANPARRELMN